MKTTRLAMALLLALAPTAWGAAVGVYSTPDGSSCNLTLPIYTPGVVYTCFTGTSTAPVFREVGMAAVEFRVPLPPGWIAVSQPSPAAHDSDGDPFGEGAFISFLEGQTGDCILLYTTTIFATTDPTDVVLQVTGPKAPHHPEHECAYAWPMDPPLFGGHGCVGGGSLFINSQRECNVATDPMTWSRVKRLFE
jgi:hypothetical protein